MNYYEHHLGDWAAATGHLTWDEDMAYTRLLRAYYHHEQAIAEGQQYRLAKASTPAQRKAVDQVLSEFFELRNGRYHQKRADAEIAKYQDKQRKAKASADARWAQSKGNANAMRTHSDGNAHQTPDTKHQTNTPQPPEGFDEFWAIYPNHKAKQNALKAWKRLSPSGTLKTEILEAVAAQAQTDDWLKDGGKFVPHGATYLNGRRWEDEGARKQPGLKLVGVI